MNTVDVLFLKIVPQRLRPRRWGRAVAARAAIAAQLTVRVTYPLQSGRIVLRTDADWNRNVEADAVTPDRSTFSFHFNLNEPYFYFKPCLVDGNQFTWSQGTNYLAIMNEPGGRSIYPHFFQGMNGSISDRIDVPSPPSASRHRIRVYRPPGYFENTLKRYPVLYMHDGANLFFPQEAFTGVDWNVEGTMDLLDAMNIIDEVIVVGVYANDRMDEYTQPGYEAYGQYLVQVLKPYIDANYRTLTDAANTAVLGSSLGGVVALYLGWQWPEVYGKVGCMSSTFTYKDDLMDRIATEAKRNIKIYLDSGWPEDNYEVTRAMRDLLVHQGYKFGTDLFYLAFPEALHSETYWAMRSHIPFQFFFGQTPSFSI